MMVAISRHLLVGLLAVGASVCSAEKNSSSSSDDISSAIDLKIDVMNPIDTDGLAVSRARSDVAWESKTRFSH